jgi:hypothetical protein
MVKHRSGTWWPDDREVGWRYVWSTLCTRRWGVLVSWFGLKTGGFRFPGLSLKTNSYGLEIWASKSSWWFLELGLKTKWDAVCQLCHKTNERMKTALDLHQDLAACFTWKQVELGFPSLASRLPEARRGWCMWHHSRSPMEMKLKTDRSMR